MLAIYNNAPVDLIDGSFSSLNRAFRYGDGLFETIASFNGAPRFLDRHLKRLQAGARVLGLENADIFDETLVASNCRKLHENSSSPAFGVLRLYLFRDGGGQYTPANSSAGLLMTYESKLSMEIAMAQKVGFTERVFNLQTATSRFKTMSALPYVLAGKEKTERSLDDVIILDHRGFVSESLSANIFWKKGAFYFTPSIETGCIEGIMRNWLIEKLRDRHHTVSEVLMNPDEMLGSESVFAVNALGLTHILAIEKYPFSIDRIVNGLLLSIS